MRSSDNGTGTTIYCGGEVGRTKAAPLLADILLMQRNTWITLLASAVAVTTLLTGCEQTHEIGKSTKQLFRGEAEGSVQQKPDQVATAIDQAIADVNLIRIGTTTKPSDNTFETIVTARDTKDNKILIAYQSLPDGSTHVVVSTGVLGNSDLRDRVWDAVRIRLGMINVTASTPTPSTRPSFAQATTQPTSQPTSQPVQAAAE